MKKVNIDNIYLDILSVDEQINLYGGGFFKNLGASAHQAWCNFSEAVVSAFNDYAVLYENSYKNGYRGPF